jgi:glycerol-3-phosphate dehydrogenase
LETFQFRLVYECLRERKLLLKNAPNLVSLKKFYIPLYKNSKRPPWLVRLGLSLYSILGGFGSGTGFRQLAKQEWSALDGIEQKDLIAVFQYFDAQTDDAGLTQAVARSAESLGTTLLFNVEPRSIDQDGREYTIVLDDGTVLRTKALVNAAGPWINQVAEKVSPAIPQIHVDLVKGTHLVLDIGDIEKYYYLESPVDGRAFFVLPWKGQTLVGTTEVNVKTEEEYFPEQEEIDYLLNNFNHFFPAYGCDESSITEKFAGVRVLPGDAGGLNANKKKRESIFLSNGSVPYYCAVYGGKLTSYRATAEKVTCQIESFLPYSKIRANTRNISLE